MSRRSDGSVELRLTAGEVALILEDLAADGVLIEKMRGIRPGDDCVAAALEADLEELLDAIAASANHCEDRDSTSQLDALLDRLVKAHLGKRVSSAGLAHVEDTKQPAGVREEPSYVLQLRIELLEIDPPVWRRIQVPEGSTLWDLHVAIQDAMGWTDSHLHEFTFLETLDRVGLPFDDDQHRTIPGWRQRVDRYRSHHAPLALYQYDFGESWRHEVRFEAFVRRDGRRSYPRCLAGARRCPPEGCGGSLGYAEFLEAVMDPDHAENEAFHAWAGGPFDPEAYAPARVRFSDPKKRLHRVLQDRP